MMRKWFGLCFCLCIAASLTACSSSKKKENEPLPLPTYTSDFVVRELWRTNIGKVDFPLVPSIVGGYVIVASSNGTVKALDYSTGKAAWSGAVDSDLSAGVGSNGRITAVVTRNNDLIALDDKGNVIWRQRVASQVLTPPVVSGGRVFVNATDRTIQAYDASNGAGLWRQQQNIMDSLTLRQNGVLDTYANTLIVGLSANLYGVDPDTGAPQWGVPIGSPRGSNEIDRLGDLVGGVAKNGSVFCARSYQNAVSCIQVGSHVLWSKKSDGDTGVAADDRYVYAVEADGRIVALDQTDGHVIWTNDQFKWRTLTAPLVLGARTLVIGDSEGNVHFLSRQDGKVIGRLFTDRSGIASTPVAIGDVLIIVTKSGSVYGFRPQ